MLGEEVKDDLHEANLSVEDDNDSHVDHHNNREEERALDLAMALNHTFLVTINEPPNELAIMQQELEKRRLQSCSPSRCCAKRLNPTSYRVAAIAALVVKFRRELTPMSSSCPSQSIGHLFRSSR